MQEQELANRVIELEKNLKGLATQVQDALNQQKADLIKSSSRLEAIIRWQIEKGALTVDKLIEILNDYSTFRDNIISIRALETVPEKIKAITDYNKAEKGFEIFAEDLDFKRGLEKVGGPSKETAQNLLGLSVSKEYREYLAKYVND